MSEKPNYSIHPRVVNGRTVHEKVNTRGEPSKNRLKNVLEAIQTHLIVHPNDRLSQNHVAALKKRIG
jgi:hypothetical protein